MAERPDRGDVLIVTGASSPAPRASAIPAPWALGALAIAAASGVALARVPGLPLLLAGLAAVATAWLAIRRAAASPALALSGCMAFLLIADRWVVYTGIGGGSGMLRPAWVALAALAVALPIAHTRSWAALQALVRHAPAWLVFLGIGVLLPLLGVTTGQPLRTLLAVVTPLAALAGSWLGALAARSRRDDGRLVPLVQRAFIATAWLAAATGVGQFLWYYARGLVSWLAPVIAWDRASTIATGGELIIGRATGIFFNPNTFSLLGGTLLVYALAAAMPVRRRLALATPSLVMVVLGQSRGIIAALAVTAVIELVIRARKIRLSPGALSGIALSAIVGIAFVALLMREVPVYFQELTARLDKMLEVVLHGAGADRNLAGRFGFWSQGWALLQSRPFGTFASPEAFLGTAVDNDLLRMTLQGGFLYLASFLAALASLFGGKSTGPWREPLRALVPFILVASLTQLPTTTPVFAGIVALLVGLHAGWQREEAS